jgi:hypothetical protein
MKKYIYSIIILLVSIFALKMLGSQFFASSTAGLHGLLQTKKADYIFIGSSQTRQAFNPYILEDSLKSTYNISYGSISLPYINFMVDYIIEHKIAVKKIIVEINLNQLYDKPVIVDTRLFEDVDFWSKIKLIKIAKPYMKTFDLYSMVMLSGNESIITWPVTVGFINSRSYRGGYINKTVMGVSQEMFTTFKPKYTDPSTPAEINPACLEALNQIVKTLRKNNISVVFVEPPLPGPVTDAKFYPAIRANIMSYITNKLHCTYIGNSEYQFDVSNPLYFHDEMHMSTLGRDIFTKKIVGLVR